MDDITDLVTQYYDAVIVGDDARANSLLNKVRDIVLALLLFYGKRNLTELHDELIDDLPDIKYEPASSVVDSLTTNFIGVLTGLGLRMAGQLTSKSVEEVIAENLYQVRRIIESQSHLIEQATQLDIVAQLAETYSLRIVKVWVAKNDPATCEICRAMDGTVIELFDTFDTDIIGADLVYNAGANAHPYCRCRIEFRVERTI